MPVSGNAAHRPPARGGPQKRSLQAAPGHPQGVALLYATVYRAIYPKYNLGQASRQGWPYSPRLLSRQHEPPVYSRATSCGWPARRGVGGLRRARTGL